MKKVLFIFASLLIITSAFAFEKGTVDVGGTASLSMHKADSDAETLTTISVSPLIGYFVAENTCVDGTFLYESQSQDDESISIVGIGIGARHFFNRFYAGADLQFQSQSIDFGNDGSWLSGTRTVSGTFIQPKIGVLAPLSPSVFIDCGAAYQIGFGSWGGDGSGDNETTNLKFQFGLHYFFKR